MRETVVLQAIEQLRRDLRGYYEQLVAHNELEGHCDNMHKRISELADGLLAGMKAENERLHEYVTKLEQANIVLDSDNTELRNDMKDMQMIVSDNHKLRELVLYMWDFSCVAPDEPHTSKEELDYSVEVWKRMRELGIEVES